MMNDTVREELETKIARPPMVEARRAEVPKFEPILPWVPQAVKVQASAAQIPNTAAEQVKPSVAEPVKPKIVTSKLKKETSPTLVDFQPANPAVPDWRLQLQNSIRKRNSSIDFEPATAPATTARPNARTASRLAQRAEPIIQNEKLANAIKRIEASKKTFGSGAAVGRAVAAAAKAKKPAVPNRSFPFDIVERNPSTTTAPRPAPIPVLTDPPKPKLVSPLRIEKKKFDTNKLPPIPEPDMPFPVETENVSGIGEATTEVVTKLSFDRLTISNPPEPAEVLSETEDDIHEEIDDLAPFSMRFGAAVFDMIIGGFAAGVLLSPFLLFNILTVTGPGVLAIVGGTLAVLFVYFTGTIAFMGRTVGMQLFSIEIIDAEANELPTFYQAAVNSSVYILSLLLLGIGFLPAFFNEERRAMHDLLSGTLLIREY
jgi:uncharacterized RDD family membrane protein YckC